MGYTFECWTDQLYQYEYPSQDIKPNHKYYINIPYTRKYSVKQLVYPICGAWKIRAYESFVFTTFHCEIILHAAV